jgi:excisionase family DNA binding protein
MEKATGLTTAQAAALAGVSEKSVRNWLKAGHLTPLATLEGRRIDKQQLLDYLRERAEATVSHLPPEVRPGIAPESEPISVPAPEASPNGHYVEEVPPAPEPVAPPLTPETINIVLQPLLDRLNESEKERRRLHDENIELAGRVGYYQAELAQYKERVLLLEAPKEVTPPLPLSEDPPEGHQMPRRRAEEPKPWYKRLLGLE